MSEKDNTPKKSTLTLGSSKLTLGGVKSGQVSQNLSHGRGTKSVQVEVKRKRRVIGSKDSSGTTSADIKKSLSLPAAKNDDGLTDNERELRLKVLQNATKNDEEKAKLEAEKEQRRKEKELERQKEEEDKDKDKEKIKLEEELLEEKVKTEHVKPVKVVERVAAQTPASGGVKLKEKKDFEKEERKPSRPTETKRRSNKLTIAQALSGSAEDERIRSLASVRRAREKARKAAAAENQGPKEKMVREIILPEIITVQELANRMAERVVDVTKCLMKMGMMVTANQSLDADTAELVIAEFGNNVKRVTDADVEDILKDDGFDNESNLEPRAPVVTFMGHVDHGKTSLLDAIRKAKVADGEAGGITQHIGAYQVKVHGDEKITFLDTPGHEAFTAMRKRGANATDIVVLVVAADDGIMAQTIEAINHAKAAEVPIIVAINKIDKEGADANRVRTSLLEHELVTEDMGGDIMAVEVSAKTGKNLDGLLDAILLQSEMLELTANPDRKSSGVVIESRVDKSKGVISTFLVQKGTLAIGDIVIVGEAFGRIRAMKSDSGRVLTKAKPSMPIEVLGLDEAPEAGVEFHVVDSEKQAREIKEYRQKRARDLKATIQQKKSGSLEDMFLQAKDGGKKMLPVVIKGDVQGSIEAIIGSLDKLETDEVGVKVLHSAVGGITTSDITLANASNAIVLAFNVRADSSAKEMAASEGSDIRYYSIIYDLIDDMKAIMGGMLAPTIREVFIGNAEIREVFNMSKYGKVAGCYVTDGMMKRGAGVRLLRDNVVIHEGKLKTLKRFKDEVKEVAANFECGMAFENYEDLKAGDQIEAFELVEESRTL